MIRLFRFACMSAPGEQLLRLQLHDAATVQRIGIGTRGTVCHQSLLCGRNGAAGTRPALPQSLLS